MKYISTLYFFLLTVCFAFLFPSCKKAEPLNKAKPQIVKVLITGSTTKDLEFLFKDSVIISAAANAGIRSTILLNVADDANGIKVREKGSSEILNTWTVPPSSFNQTFSIFYDGSKVYDTAVDYQLKGYAMSGELEFLLDGQVVSEGSLKIDNTLIFPINKDQTRTLEVRKKGETAVLITKNINSSPTSGQSLKFFFDGLKLVDNVQLNPPKNPANMSITGQFKTTNNVGATFKGGDVDLVFYIRNTSGLITIPDPQVRVTMPASGAFVNFELPPLPDDQSFYTYDICEPGTNAIPYINAVLASTYPPRENRGLFGELRFDGEYFKAGASKLLLMQDATRVRTSPASARARFFYGQVTDLSEYFQ